MKDTATDLENKIVRGVKVEFVPEVGMGVQKFVGSDTYGYEVISVDENDRYSFDYGRKTDNGIEVHGTAVLVTRKNSKTYGKYREAVLKSSKNGDVFVPMPICKGVGCEHIGNLYLTGKQGEAETCLDPSF